MILSSFVIGVLASIAGAFATNRFCAPKIAISNKIIIRPTTGTGIIKIQNTSSWLAIYDISIYLRYCSKSRDYYPATLAPVALLKVKPSKKKRKCVESEPYEMKLKLKEPKQKGNEKDIPISKFFEGASPKRPYLDVVIICYSKISGSTRHAIQQRYYSTDICENHFFPEGSLEAEPIEAGGEQ